MNGIITTNSHRVVREGNWPKNPTAIIANAARVSHLGEDSDDLWKNRGFVERLMSWGHWSPFEFVDICFRCFTSRDVTHELVRHRLASYMQESQRYCKYDIGLDVIVPEHILMADEHVYANWLGSLKHAHKTYKELLAEGIRPEDARTVLPGCTATRILFKCNLREFRHFLDLRTDKCAWSEMRIVARQMADAFVDAYPDHAYLIADVVHAEVA